MGKCGRTNPTSHLAPAHRRRNREPCPGRPGTYGAAIPQIVDKDAPGALSGRKGERVAVGYACGEALRDLFA